jgi:hypothetical protein
VDIHLLFPLGKTLHCDDTLTSEMGDRLDTATNFHSIGQNGTGSADSFAASILNRCKSQIITKEREHFLVLVTGDGFSVDNQGIHPLFSFN